MTTVLVVEDDTTFRSTLARDLASRGHTVLVASGVDEALAALAGGQCDVLLTDLRLGGRDGIDLLKRARTIAPATRSVLMSGFASARDYQRAIELGAVRVLCKPFSSAELNQAIEHARDCSQGYSGNMHGLSLIDVLQLYQFARRSIAIQVVGGHGGQILLRDGAFVHAEHGDLVGERALRALLAAPSGVLRSEALPASYPISIERPAQAVLLDCLRQLDEGGAQLAGADRSALAAELDDPVETAELARERLRVRWRHLVGSGAPPPATADVVGVDLVAGAAVQLAGAEAPDASRGARSEAWPEASIAPLGVIVGDIERVCGARRGAMQATLGQIQLAVLWDHAEHYCFLITDVATSVASGAWFRTFATAAARGVLAG